jgi:hypothetical protein
MRVSGVKDAGFAVSARENSPRVFLRLGFQRYAATTEEAIELARQLVAAVDAVREGRECTNTYTPEGGDGGDQ